ncbi:hypothetical protein L2E82_19446 [Cichorium intybus]|uniref:Uncharacterized protein n=1 Tax=Cichorium intybus TaxID=13427 RepID=A0ACB9FCP7_CICIN|nr:hypothetical protein L2E82_19446 [Cichorium intybus]
MLMKPLICLHFSMFKALYRFQRYRKVISERKIFDTKSEDSSAKPTTFAFNRSSELEEKSPIFSRTSRIT